MAATNKPMLRRRSIERAELQADTASLLLCPHFPSPFLF
jgi:hypothetical protein